MKPIFTLLILTIALNVFAQETVKIVKTSKKTYTKEIYHVLKSNKSVRHGLYQRFGYNDRLEITGYFKNGKKDSLWTEYDYNENIKSQGYYFKERKNGLWQTYHHNSTILRNKGTYIDDQKSGIWEFYNSESELVQEYDFDKNELLFHLKGTEPSFSKESLVKTDSGVVEMVIDRYPLYIGGAPELINHIQSNVKYPEVALVNGIKGNVIVSFFVNSDGSTDDFQITSKRKYGGGLEEEALRVVSLMKGFWIPGVFNNLPVTVKVSIPIIFRLSK